MRYSNSGRKNCKIEEFVHIRCSEVVHWDFSCGFVLLCCLPVLKYLLCLANSMFFHSADVFKSILLILVKFK